MYPDSGVGSVPVEQPQAFKVIEECHQVLSGIEAKLSPIMSGGSEKLAGETPSISALDSRLQTLLSHIREINKRIKL